LVGVKRDLLENINDLYASRINNLYAKMDTLQQADVGHGREREPNADACL
jgi:hypothetical protein